MITLCMRDISSSTTKFFFFFFKEFSTTFFQCLIYNKYKNGVKVSKKKRPSLMSGAHPIIAPLDVKAYDCQGRRTKFHQKGNK